MNNTPSRLGAAFLVVAVGVGFGVALSHHHAQTLFSPATANAQTVDGNPPTVSSQPLAGSLAHTDSKGRHLAPHDTFYLLEYVSVKTDKGVEGFEPGQEVHFVEAHRPTQTLVVSDGHAQVEVSPAKLTNDMDIAALVRQKDQANQNRVAAYIQAEQVAYQKAEKEAADATAKDLEHHNQEKVAESTVGTSTQADLPAQPTDTSANGNVSAGYYGYGNTGYGSPYSYFGGGGGGGTTVVLGANAPTKAPSTAPVAPAAPAAGKVAAPGGSGAGKAK